MRAAPAACGIVAGLHAAAALRAAARLQPGTRIDPAGLVTSVQAADFPATGAVGAALEDPRALERLAERYWAHVARLFRGLVVAPRTGDGRRVALVVAPLVLLRLAGPLAVPGRAAWRVTGGLLGGGGELAVEVERGPAGTACVRVVLESYRPSLAVHGHPGLYLATQAWVHEWVGRGWLAGLQREEPPEGGSP